MTNSLLFRATTMSLFIALFTTACIDPQKDQIEEENPLVDRAQETDKTQDDSLPSNDQTVAPKEDDLILDDKATEPEEDTKQQTSETDLPGSDLVENEPEPETDTQTDVADSPAIITDDEEQIRLANEMLGNLAFQEFYVNTSATSEANFVVSPLSSFNTTAMLLHAANGESAANILTALDWDNMAFPLLSSWSTSFSNLLEWNTSVWGQTEYAFAETYLDDLYTIFGSEYSSVDFLHLEAAAKDEITPWVPEIFSEENSTITTSLDKLIKRTRLIFANKFNLELDLLSASPAFELTEGLWQDATAHQEKLPMLKVQGEFPVYRAETFDAIEVPMASDTVALTIVMPTHDGFSQSEAELKQLLVDFQTNASAQNVEFMLPVFEIQSSSKIDTIVPDGVYPKNATACPETGCSDYIPEDNKAYDYSTVNNQGFLYRESLKGESSLVFSEQGLKAQAASVAVLNATLDEPINVLFPLPGFAGFSGGSQSGSDFTAGLIVTSGPNYGSIEMEPCTKVMEAPGPTQARPFLFLLSDVSTDSIVQMGRVTELSGEQAVGKQVCRSEKIVYADNIWPLLDETVTDTGHVLSDDYIASDFEADENNINWTTTFLNRLSLEAFAKIDAEQRNALSAPVNEFLVSLMSRIAAPEENLNTWLSSWSEEINREQLLHNLRVPDSLSANVNNKLWLESDYLVQQNYLDTLVNDLGVELNLSEFLEDSSAERVTISTWLDQIMDNSFNFQKLISNRTRLFYGAAENASLMLNDTQLTTGTFVNEDGVHSNLSLVRFEGQYNFYEDDTLQSLELGDEDNQLLVIMPKESFFTQVQTQLSSTLENILSNLSKQQISFSIPVFSLNNVENTIANEATDHYLNASTERPLFPSSQYTKNEVSFNQAEFQYSTYSLSSLAAPADDGTVGGFLGYPRFEINPIVFASPICSSNLEEQTTRDSRPFIYILRDRVSGTIKQIGRVQDVLPLTVACQVEANI